MITKKLFKKKNIITLKFVRVHKNFHEKYLHHLQNVIIFIILMIINVLKFY